MREAAVTETTRTSAPPPVRPGADRSRPARLVKQLIRYRYLMLLALPAIVYFFIFRYIPIYGLTLAFKDYNIHDGILRSPWVGLKYFRWFFTMHRVGHAWLNTLKIASLKILFGFPAPIILALLLNEIKNLPFKKTIQTISYMPHFLSWVVVAGLITELLSPNRGPIGYVIRSLGGTPPVFLMSARLFVPILIITNIWKTVGWGTIIYLATISSINPELYEAATVDGAGRFRQVWHITIPGLIPVITILLILQAGGILNAGFDQIFNLINRAVWDVAETLGIFIYYNGVVGFQYSFTTAVGLSQNVISFILVFSANMLARRFSDYALW